MSDEPQIQGVDLLLDIVGGLLVALIVDHGAAFLKYVSQMSGDAGYLPVWVAYCCYLLNVFRQVHGMVLVNHPTGRFAQVLAKASRREGIFGFFALLFVLGVPCLLIVHMESMSCDPASSAWFLPFGTHALWIFGAYFLTGLCYVVWDVITERMLKRVIADTSVASSTKDRAKELLACVRRWKWGYWAALGVCAVAFAWMSLKGWKVTPPGAGDKESFVFPAVSPWFPWLVVIITGGYTAYDYLLNRRFYFPIENNGAASSTPAPQAATT